MKALICAVTLLFLTNLCVAQHVYPIRADSVRIYSNCDTAELILENRTKDTLGFLFNKGNGRTEFRKLNLINVGASGIAIEGQDTIQIAGGSAGNLQTVTDKGSVTTHSITTDSGFIVKTDDLWFDEGHSQVFLNTTFNYPILQGGYATSAVSGVLGSYLNISAPNTLGYPAIGIWDGDMSIFDCLTIEQFRVGNYSVPHGPRVRAYSRADGPDTRLSLYLGKTENIFICNTNEVGLIPANVGIGYFDEAFPEAKLHIKGDLRLDNDKGILIRATGTEANNPSDLRIIANQNSSAISSSGKNAGTVSNLILQSAGYRTAANGVGNVGIKNETPTSTLDVTGSFSLNSIITTTTSVTLDINHYVVLVNNTAAVNITLPPANTCKGRMYVIKKISNNTIAASVVRSGTDTIDGSASPYTAIAGYMATQTFISNGAAWYAIGH